jgi:hypothetical protein
LPLALREDVASARAEGEVEAARELGDGLEEADAEKQGKNEQKKAKGKREKWQKDSKIT